MIQEDDLISVIMPAYNSSAYVREAIWSVLNQTYSNLELVVIDDCSTDDTYSICQSIAQKDKRLRVFRNETNMKIACTLNRALDFAMGSFIARMDSDDISMPDRLTKQFQYLKKNPQFMLVGSSIQTIDTLGRYISTQSMPVYPNSVNALKFGSTLAHPTWFARREFFAAVGKYRISGVEDYDYLLRASNKGLLFTNIVEPLVKYRLSNNNSAHVLGLKQIKLSRYIKKLNSNNNEFNPTKEDLQKVVECSRWSNLLYDLSQKKLDRAYVSKTKVLKFAYFTFAALISPYGAIRLFNAIAWKLSTK